jgi:hypothetical protein
MMKKFVVAVLLFIIGVPILGMIFLGARRTAGTMMTFDGDSVAVRQGRGVGGSVMSLPATDAKMMTQELAYPDMMPQPVPDYGYVNTPERTVVKNAYLSLLTADTRKLVSDITAVVKQVEGTVTQTNVYEIDEEGTVQAEMTLRVPEARLDEALSAIRPLATKVTSENMSADDRTEYRVDMEVQLRNLQATETKLLAIMEQAETVEETLRVQQELSRIRRQIESLEAQQANLAGAAAMASIQVSIATQESSLPIVNPQQDSVWEEIQVSARMAIELYRELFILGLRLSILAAPLLVGGVVIALIWKLKKRT